MHPGIKVIRHLPLGESEAASHSFGNIEWLILSLPVLTCVN